MSRPAVLIAIIVSLLFLSAAPLAAQDTGPPLRFSGAKACRAMKAAAWKAGRTHESRASTTIDAVSYTLHVDVDFENRRINAVCDVGLRGLVFDLNEFTLDFGNLAVTSVVEDFTQNVSFTQGGGELTITPSTPIGVGEERVYSVTYSGSPEAGVYFNGGNGGVCYTHSQPEDARHWFPCKDVPDDKADWCRTHITAPSDMLVASNGTLTGIDDNGDGTSTSHYFHDFPIATYLISFAVSDYDTFTQTCSSGVPLKYFVYPNLYDMAVYDWENIPAMVDFYDSVYHPYPFESYGMAVAPFGGAMENQTMTTWTPAWITGDRLYEGTVAHELAHMWWGDMVTCEDWPNIWLNEGFAVYFDALFTEHFYGEDAFRYQMTINRWNYIGGESSEGRFPVYDPDYMWGVTVYEKGAWVLHMLRRQVGTAVFTDIIREWADRYQYASAATEDLLEVCEDVSGQDLGWFFEQWVYKAGYPVLRVDWGYDAGTATIDIDQIQPVDELTPLFSVPVDLLIRTPAGDVQTTVWVDGESQSFQVTAPAHPTQVIVDPDVWLLCLTVGTDGVAIAPGPDPNNPCAVQPSTAYGQWLGPEIHPYGVDRFGANVGAGDLDGDGLDELLTGPGPGAVFGPHVRGFEVDGSPLPGVSFLAYGTNRWGVRVAAGDLDGDGYEEIITGAGPGAVFGPHVRGFDYDGVPPAVPMNEVSFFAYGTLRWGVNVAAGDLDGDGYDEIVTGAGPGAVFGPHVRGFDCDGGTAAPMTDVSFFAYGTPRWGVKVAAGDFDADGMDEILTGPGPGSAFPLHIRAFNYDGEAVTPMNNINFIIDDFRFGSNVAAADIDGNGADDLVIGPGPDPMAPAAAGLILIDEQGMLILFSVITPWPDAARGSEVAGGGFPINATAPAPPLSGPPVFRLTDDDKWLGTGDHDKEGIGAASAVGQR